MDGTSKNTMWMVRSGSNSAYFDDFLEWNEVTIGFEDVGPIDPEKTSREDVLQRMMEAYPSRKRATNLNAAGQLYRFHADIHGGDAVVTYNAGQRQYYIGHIVGPVRYVEDGGEYEQFYRRPVEWKERCDRDRLRVATKNTLGSTLTIFKINEEAAEDLRSNARSIDAPPDAGPPPPSDTRELDEDAAIQDLRREMIAKADDFIDDMIVRLDPEEVEDLVASILRAMGYKARRTAMGPDRGVDVFASPDGLGLEEPRIFVEVKHRKERMGAQEIRSFLGGRSQGDRCLFVSTGDFTKEARYEAERSAVPLTLVDLPTLRELLLEHYENGDIEMRRLVPLRRIYWPAEVD